MNGKVVLIGGSAGSISVVKKMLNDIETSNFPPIVLVLHRGDANLDQLIEMLNKDCRLSVKEATHFEHLEKGNVYLAPADYHLLISPLGRIELDYSEPVLYSRPSIDVSAISFARSFKEKVVYIVLSGANEDGAKGAQVIQNKGGKLIVQSPEEAEFKSMPNSTLTRCKKVEAIATSDNLYLTLKQLI